MEFASLEDAFPQTESYTGKNSQSSKGNRTKEGFQGGLPPTDADRPAVVRMNDIPAMNQGSNQSQNVLDDLLDESSKFLKKPTVNNSLPKPRSLNSLEKGTLPSYFGAEPFTNPNDDTHASFTNVKNKNAYMLESDFTKSFDGSGYQKATGSELPVPELRSQWKLMSANRVESAAVAPNANKSGGQFAGMGTAEIDSMRSKIDQLMARLDDLENRAAGANPQLEVMSFIMTGLFLMFVIDLAVRKSTTMRMVNVR
jgi:hypothetical protein